MASAVELAALDAQPPLFEDDFDLPPKGASPPPDPILESNEPYSQVDKRPGVSSQQNVDEFPPVTGRFLRFVITRTNDNTAPGLDELEVFGADPKRNLALMGKPSASAVISGLPARSATTIIFTMRRPVAA